jgi:phosphatidylinositol kinase/protein kinase (PI-3  family)
MKLSIHFKTSSSFRLYIYTESVAHYSLLTLLSFFSYSVATSSMIGYILGIGDRHTVNILVDKSTAEVIHIDFGKLPIM